MGNCCGKIKEPDEVGCPNTPADTELVDSYDFSTIHVNLPSFTDSHVVDQLVLDMLGVAASRVDSEDESPVSLVKLHIIADKEDGWIQMVISMVNVIPLETPFGPTAISILLDDCPLPSRETVIKVTKMYRLSERRASFADLDVTVERNLCIILGCIAEKLIGPNSAAVFTKNTLDYLYTFLRDRRDPCLTLFSLIALQKFAYTTENKLIIKARLEQEKEHPLLILEKLVKSEDYLWRQVGFSANWALDNMFVVDGRPCTYEMTDNTYRNALLNANDVSEYLQISSDGVEARCDSYSFESVRCTFQVDEGCWYYECLIITPGVMQIGWATKNSYFHNDEGYGIGDDNFSISYDGCRKLVWYCAKPLTVGPIRSWRSGDILGCLIDVKKKEVIFSLNGERVTSCRQIFESSRYGFYAAASFMAYQQCRFNFGYDPFEFPPTDRHFNNFNEHGVIGDEERVILPRRIALALRRCSSIKEDSCTICYDETASCILEPCGHRGFCSVCTAQIRDCPLCRADILNVRREGGENM